MAQVQLTQLSKVFPDGTIGLDRVDLMVADGEFVVLVGPSGCGKSTLLRVIAGLDFASGGSVSIGGKVVDDLTPKERDIAMVFQNYALYPHMTVGENIGFSLKLQRMPKAEVAAEIHEIAHMLALEPLLDRKPKALSGGQRQRVAMGRAMVRHPKVFLMDEPLSNLDAKLRVAMRGELIRLHQQNKVTTLYVTHDQVEAMTLGDRIAVLNAGQLQQVGTPDELYRSPCNVFVAGFIGSPAMNLVNAKLVIGADGELALTVGGQQWSVPDERVDQQPVLRTLVGHNLVMGLRPDAIGIDARSDDLGARIRVTAVTVESLGNEKNVLFLPPFETVAVAGAPASKDTELIEMWTASVDPDTAVSAGSMLTLCLDLTRAYFFDAETGLAIPASRQIESAVAA